MLKRFRYKTWPKPAVTMCGMALHLAAIGVDKGSKTSEQSFDRHFLCVYLDSGDVRSL